MSSLTTNLILQKTRQDDLRNVKKLNACGVQVDDIRVMSSVPRVEVCSLSANCIFDLTPLVDCPNMKELYLRKNNISELHQVLYLTGAPNLQVLRLSENPVCEHPDYRAYTIAALSNLQQFDDEPVSPQERQSAERAFPNILEDIRNLPAKEASSSPRANNAAPPPPQPAARRASSFEREQPRSDPATARLPTRSNSTTFGQQQDSGSFSSNNGYNGDDIPISGARQNPALRRAQSDVIPRAKTHQKPFAAAPRDLPALEQVNTGAQTAKDQAMVQACASLMNEMSPEGLIAVKAHLSRLGL